MNSIVSTKHIGRFVGWHGKMWMNDVGLEGGSFACIAIKVKCYQHSTVGDLHVSLASSGDNRLPDVTIVFLALPRPPTPLRRAQASA